MNRLLIASTTTIALALLGSAATVYAINSVAAKKAECFRMHGNAMDKPAVKTDARCWQAHAYLMNRQPRGAAG